MYQFYHRPRIRGIGSAILALVVLPLLPKIAFASYDAEIIGLQHWPSPRYVNQTVTLTMTVKNTGTQLGTFWFHMVVRQDGFLSDPVVLDQWYKVDDIPVGGSKSHSFYWTPTEADEYKYEPEVWNVTKDTRHDSWETGWYPVLPSVIVYEVYGAIDSWEGGTDVDGDGFYETFSFRIGIDGDVSPGSASVYGRMICTTTGQSWWSASAWTITGTATDYLYFGFDETYFAGHITGNTSLDFTVELWDSSKTTKLATDTSVSGEPVKVGLDVLPLPDIYVHPTLLHIYE